MAGGLLGEEDQPLSEINVVPLVDVMLVLLVMFIIAAPVFAQALGVNLPRVDAQPSAEPTVANVVLHADGRLLLDDVALPREVLAQQLALRVEAEPALVVRLGADAAIPYQAVAELVGLLQASGVRRLALATRSPS